MLLDKLNSIKVLQKYNECGRKIASSKDGAQRRAKNQRRQGKQAYHYKCTYCIHWHVASGVKYEPN